MQALANGDIWYYHIYDGNQSRTVSLHNGGGPCCKTLVQDNSCASVATAVKRFKHPSVLCTAGLLKEQRPKVHSAREKTVNTLGSRHQFYVVHAAFRSPGHEALLDHHRTWHLRPRQIPAQIPCHTIDFVISAMPRPLATTTVISLSRQPFNKDSWFQISIPMPPWPTPLACYHNRPAKHGNRFPTKHPCRTAAAAERRPFRSPGHETRRKRHPGLKTPILCRSCRISVTRTRGIA